VVNFILSSSTALMQTITIKVTFHNNYFCLTQTNYSVRIKPPPGSCGYGVPRDMGYIMVHIWYLQFVHGLLPLKVSHPHDQLCFRLYQHNEKPLYEMAKMFSVL